MIKESTLKPISGFSILVITLSLIALSSYLFVINWQFLPITLILVSLFIIKGFIIINPNEAIVLVLFGNYSGISVGVKLFGGCDDFSGEYLTNPTIPNKYTNVIIGDIILKDHVLIGSNSIVLPNVILAEGTAIGSNSLVKKSTNEWKI